ncbi:drebrin-like isoform X1 [Arapaima gigas]
MRAVNLDTYSLSLLTAKEDIANPRSSTSWALFRYDGITNNLKLSDSGVGGLAELAGKFHPNWPFYGLCRVGADGSGRPRIILIAWVGEGVDQYRRTECASHLPAIKAFFKEAHICVSATTLEDVTEERISVMFSQTETSASKEKQGSRFVDKSESVGTNYKRTIAAMEIKRINRDSFWARSEREEEERKDEERRRAEEARRRWERERIQQELREAEERERKMEEKEQMLQEQRRLQAKMEEEAQKREILRWEQQQREDEEDVRAGCKQSQYVDKAAEAAALVSQRSVNPREFFRRLSSSSSSQAGADHALWICAGRPPFRHYNRSLTETAFIFGRSDSTVPADPHSLPVKPGATLAYKSVPSQIQDATDCSFQPAACPASPPASYLSPSTTPPVSVPPLEQFPPLYGGPQVVSSSQSLSAAPDAEDFLGSHSETLPASQDPPLSEEDILAPTAGPDNTPFLDAFGSEGPVTTEMGNEVELEEGLKEQATLVNPSGLPVTVCSLDSALDTDSNIILVADKKECEKQEQDGSSVVELKAYNDDQVSESRRETDAASVMEDGVPVLAIPLSSSTSTSAMEDEVKEKEEEEKSTTTLDLVPEQAEHNYEDTDVLEEVGMEEKAAQRYELPACAADQSGETSLPGEVEVEEALVDISAHEPATGGL